MGKASAHKDTRKLARGLGQILAGYDQRLHSLALSFDCLVTVLNIDVKVKQELMRRKEAAEKAKMP